MALDLILQVFRNAHQRAFRQRARQVYNNDREFREVDFFDFVFFSTVREIGLNGVHSVADIRKDFRLVPAKFKFKHHVGVVFHGRASNAFQPV